MSFSEEFKKYKKKVKKICDNGNDMTEEATKNALIMPFFVMLGYDVFNTDEFMPEYTCDVAIKKGEKVDYAILQDGEPTILIEVKKTGMKLQKQQQGQLFRYFSVSRCRIAILTNGISYLFFSDINAPNVMDEEPFFSFNILDDDETLYLPALEQFCKENLNIKTILSKATFLKYEKVVEKTIMQDLISPSDELVKYFLSRPEIKTGNRITSQMIEKHRDSTLKALRKVIGVTIKSEPSVMPVENNNIIIENDITIDCTQVSEYPEIENILRKHYGNNINIECKQKPNTYYIEVSENNIKTARVRIYQREINPYDVTLFRSDGSTLKLALFNEQSELDSIIENLKAECM